MFYFCHKYSCWSLPFRFNLFKITGKYYYFFSSPFFPHRKNTFISFLFCCFVCENKFLCTRATPHHPFTSRDRLLVGKVDSTIDWKKGCEKFNVNLLAGCFASADCSVASLPHFIVEWKFQETSTFHNGFFFPTTVSWMLHATDFYNIFA